MALPVRTSLEDIQRICRYLVTKPTGVTSNEARRVLGENLLRPYKVSALKFWGLITEEEGRLRIANDGRVIAKNEQSGLSQVLKKVIREKEPYYAVLERAVHNDEGSIGALEVAAYWHENFSDDVASSDGVLNEQAVCFFQIVVGAGLGELTVGRKGAPTRIDFNHDEIEAFVGNIESSEEIESEDTDISIAEGTQGKDTDIEKDKTPVPKLLEEKRGVGRVFITHGKNHKIVEQLKEIVKFGKFTPVIAEEHETPSKPVPQKVMDDMRSCEAGIIHIASEQVLIDEEGKQHHKINENVLIEIGAAMALYKNNFILLVEQGVQLPSNLQGLYECRYEGDKLDGESTMKLLKAFNEFR